MRLTLFAAILAVALSPALAQDEPEPARRAAGVPPRAAGSGPLQVDVAAEYFVVTDPIRRQVAVYRVGTSSVQLVGARSLDADLAAEPERAPKAAGIPATDCPGEDPPGFVRPKGAVRVQARYQKKSDTFEEWSASYLVASSVEAVFEEVPRAHRDLRVAEWDIGTQGVPKRGRLVLAGSGTQLAVDLVAVSTAVPDFHVRVDVSARITK